MWMGIETPSSHAITADRPVDLPALQISRSPWPCELACGVSQEEACQELTVMVRVPAGVAPLEEAMTPATVRLEPSTALVGVTVWVMVVVAGPTGRLKLKGGTGAAKAVLSGV